MPGRLVKNVAAAGGFRLTCAAGLGISCARLEQRLRVMMKTIPTLFFALSCCCLAAAYGNISDRVDKIMENSPKTRDDVLRNRIWGDDRVPVFWEEARQKIRLEDLPLLWREASWYGLAIRWWADGECFYIFEEPGWLGHPYFILHIYEYRDNSEFVKIAKLGLRGLGDDGIFKGEVAVEQGKVIFRKKGWQTDAIELEGKQAPAAGVRKVTFKKTE